MNIQHDLKNGSVSSGRLRSGHRASPENDTAGRGGSSEGRQLPAAENVGSNRPSRHERQLFDESVRVTRRADRPVFVSRA